MMVFSIRRGSDPHVILISERIRLNCGSIPLFHHEFPIVHIRFAAGRFQPGVSRLFRSLCRFARYPEAGASSAGPV